MVEYGSAAEINYGAAAWWWRQRSNCSAAMEEKHGGWRGGGRWVGMFSFLGGGRILSSSYYLFESCPK